MKKIGLSLIMAGLLAACASSPEQPAAKPAAAPASKPAASAPAAKPKVTEVDPLKDAKAEIEQIAAGLKSRTQALAERGYDAEQVDAEIAADQAREQALGLSFGASSSGADVSPATEDTTVESSTTG